MRKGTYFILILLVLAGIMGSTSETSCSEEDLWFASQFYQQVTPDPPEDESDSWDDWEDM